MACRYCSEVLEGVAGGVCCFGTVMVLERLNFCVV